MELDVQSERASRPMGILEWSLCGLMVAIVAVTFAQIVLRYVLEASLAWTEELARYIFIWLTALGSAYAFRANSHFLLRFAVDRLPPKGQLAANAISGLLVALFLAVFVWWSVVYVGRVYDQVGPVTGLSKAFPASAAVVGGCLMLYFSIRQSLETIRAGLQNKNLHSGDA